MKIESIARIAHEVNRAYCVSIGDSSQQSWDNSPEWQRESAINGVKFHIKNPDATPEDSHISWLEEKIKDGWVYGEVKDADAKTHPCIKTYNSLPQEQRSKDYLFSCTVRELNALTIEELK